MAVIHSKKRINISVSPQEEALVRKLAKRDKVPQATKVAALLRIALELEEDSALEALAAARDRKRTTFVSHQAAWR